MGRMFSFKNIVIQAKEVLCSMLLSPITPHVVLYKYLIFIFSACKKTPIILLSLAETIY